MSASHDGRRESGDPAVQPIQEVADPGGGAEVLSEELHAQRLAARLGLEYVDVTQFTIDHDLFRSIPVDMMFRYNFVPMRAENGFLEIALSDPRNLNLIDELAILLNKKLRVKVATLSQIAELLKKTEQSQRVLEEVTEGFVLDVVREDEASDETISIEKLTGDTDISPVIRLVDTTIFNALERRASDIHIETRDQEVAIKYRIDGVLHYAMPPISKDWHQTIISRIKVMSELDIAERRIPQDGRFRVRYKGRFIDFRVSIMPTIHGEDAVLRVLDKESMSEKFHQLSLDVVGFSEGDLKKTALNQTHRDLGGRMVPFAGWEMPVVYTGIYEEHLATRQAAGLFDVSHMGVYDVRGADAASFLDTVCGNDCGGLEPGESLYTHFLTPEADVIDDTLVYRRGWNDYLVVVNASNDDKDRTWLESVRDGKVKIDNAKPWAR